MNAYEAGSTCSRNELFPALERTVLGQLEGPDCLPARHILKIDSNVGLPFMKGGFCFPNPTPVCFTEERRPTQDCF